MKTLKSSRKNTIKIVEIEIWKRTVLISTWILSRVGGTSYHWKLSQRNIYPKATSYCRSEKFENIYYYKQTQDTDDRFEILIDNCSLNDDWSILKHISHNTFRYTEKYYNYIIPNEKADAPLRVVFKWLDKRVRKLEIKGNHPDHNTVEIVYNT